MMGYVGEFIKVVSVKEKTTINVGDLYNYNIWIYYKNEYKSLIKFINWIIAQWSATNLILF